MGVLGIVTTRVTRAHNVYGPKICISGGGGAWVALMPTTTSVEGWGDECLGFELAMPGDGRDMVCGCGVSGKGPKAFIDGGVAPGLEEGVYLVAMRATGWVVV